MKTDSVTVRIDPDKHKRLNKLAESMERSKSFVIANAIDYYLDVNEWQIDEIKKALVVADNPKTKWVSHEEIKNKFKKRFHKEC